jgi:hypothetical protein
MSQELEEMPFGFGNKLGVKMRQKDASHDADMAGKQATADRQRIQDIVAGQRVSIGERRKSIDAFQEALGEADWNALPFPPESPRDPEKVAIAEAIRADLKAAEEALARDENLLAAGQKRLQQALDAEHLANAAKTILTGRRVTNVVDMKVAAFSNASEAYAKSWAELSAAIAKANDFAVSVLGQTTERPLSELGAKNLLYELAIQEVLRLAGYKSGAACLLPPGIPERPIVPREEIDRPMREKAAACIAKFLAKLETPPSKRSAAP